MSRRRLRWTDLSRSTRRRIDKIVGLMHARDQIRRRVSRAWVQVGHRHHERQGDA